MRRLVNADDPFWSTDRDAQRTQGGVAVSGIYASALWLLAIDEHIKRAAIVVFMVVITL